MRHAKKKRCERNDDWLRGKFSGARFLRYCKGYWKKWCRKGCELFLYGMRSNEIWFLDQSLNFASVSHGKCLWHNWCLPHLLASSFGFESLEILPDFMQETLHEALSMRDGHLRTACSTLGKVSRMPPETAQNSKRHLAEHFKVASEPFSLSSCCVVADSKQHIPCSVLLPHVVVTQRRDMGILGRETYDFVM